MGSNPTLGIYYQAVIKMIKKDNKYYWFAYSLVSKQCKKTGIEINPYTNEIVLELEV